MGLVAELDNERLIANRSYDTDDFLQILFNTVDEVVFPPRKNRKESREYEKHRYKERHLVMLKCHHNLARCFDNHPKSTVELGC